MAYVRVQGIGASSTAGNTVFSTLASPVASGNFVWGILTWDFSSAVTLTSVVDDKGNTYNTATTLDAADNQRSAIFWRGNVTGGPTVFTATLSGAPGFRFMLAEEWSGTFSATDPTDVTPAGNSNTPSVTGADGITSSNITTVTNGCLILGATANDDGGGAGNAGTGFTAGTSNPSAVQLNTDFKTQVTAGIVKSTFTESSVASNRTVWVLAVKPSGGVVASPFSQTDWPRVSPIRVSRSDTSIGSDPKRFTNPIPNSNAKTFFIPVQPVKLAKVDQFHTDISKFTNPIPLNVRELNRPWSVRGYPTQPQPYNANLYSQVIVAAPFAQLQWVAARSLYSQTAPPANPPYNSLIYSEVPFIPNVFAKASPFVRTQPVSQPYNVNLFQTVSVSVTARLGFHPIEAGSVKQSNIASGLQNLEDGTAG